MREIKFRAWHEPNKIMLDVIAINFSLMEITADIETRKIYPELDYWWKETDIPFSEIELMRSTGLCDKHGVEIYEGDIVAYIDKHGQKRIGKINYANAKYYIGNFETLGYAGKRYELEVIGNIWEDGDLLDSE